MRNALPATSPSSNRPPPSDRPSPTQNGPPPSIRNLLLAALPTLDRDRIVPTLDVIPLKLKDVLHKPGERVHFVYFPGGGFCSLVAVLEDGGMVEVATIGREGIAGMIPTMNVTPLSSATMVQGETDICYRMAIAAFQHEMAERGAFYNLLTRYSQALVAIIMQSTACNAVHSVEQRLARWLLTAQDHMGSDGFPLTQEFAAMMLGATRPTVTVVAGTLQRAGFITYHRGHISILDRPNLEEASCECYAVTKKLQLAVVTTAA
jgi:CRP-like cAMP-binding protein